MQFPHPLTCSQPPHLLTALPSLPQPTLVRPSVHHPCSCKRTCATPPITPRRPQALTPATSWRSFTQHPAWGTTTPRYTARWRLYCFLTLMSCLLRSWYWQPGGTLPHCGTPQRTLPRQHPWCCTQAAGRCSNTWRCCGGCQTCWRQPYRRAGLARCCRASCSCCGRRRCCASSGADAAAAATEVARAATAAMV